MKTNRWGYFLIKSVPDLDIVIGPSFCHLKVESSYLRPFREIGRSAISIFPNRFNFSTKILFEADIAANNINQ